LKEAGVWRKVRVTEDPTGEAGERRRSMIWM